MKKYYTEISFQYYDDEGVENFMSSFILYARNSISALKKINKESLKLLKEETSDNIEIYSFSIDTMYETTEDAII